MQPPADSVFVCYRENRSVATSLKCLRRRKGPGGGPCRRLLNRERLRICSLAVRSGSCYRDCPDSLGGSGILCESNLNRGGFDGGRGLRKLPGHRRVQTCKVLVGHRIRQYSESGLNRGTVHGKCDGRFLRRRRFLCHAAYGVGCVAVSADEPQFRGSFRTVVAFRRRHQGERAGPLRHAALRLDPIRQD